MTILFPWVERLVRIDNGWLVTWRNSQRQGTSFITAEQLVTLVTIKSVPISDSV